MRHLDLRIFAHHDQAIHRLNLERLFIHLEYIQVEVRASCKTVELADFLCANVAGSWHLMDKQEQDLYITCLPQRPKTAGLACSTLPIFRGKQMST